MTGTTAKIFVTTLYSFAVVVVAYYDASIVLLINATLSSGVDPTAKAESPLAVVQNVGVGSSDSHFLLCIIVSNDVVTGISASSYIMIADVEMIYLF